MIIESNGGFFLFLCWQLFLPSVAFKLIRCMKHSTDWISSSIHFRVINLKWFKFRLNWTESKIVWISKDVVFVVVSFDCLHRFRQQQWRWTWMTSYVTIGTWFRLHFGTIYRFVSLFKQTRDEQTKPLNILLAFYPAHAYGHNNLHAQNGISETETLAAFHRRISTKTVPYR